MSESFGFNSSEGKFESLISKIENQFQVSFVEYTSNLESNSFWTGTIVNFSGNFYNVVKAGAIYWSIFNLRYTNLS